MLYEQPHEPLLVQSMIDDKGGLPNGVRDLFANGHRPWYYEDLWNTPLIISGPGMPAGVRQSGLAANLDIFPTILEALDYPPIPGLAGMSLFTGRDAERDRIYAFGHQTPAIREASGKKLFIHPRTLYLLEGEGPDPTKLYDLANDPAEQHELSESSPAELARLQESIDQWKASNARDVTNTTSEAQRQILRDLGYVGGGLDFDAESGGD
jgi:arylsulfatase A-like enzyme